MQAVTRLPLADRLLYVHVDGLTPNRAERVTYYGPVAVYIPRDGSRGPEVSIGIDALTSITVRADAIVRVWDEVREGDRVSDRDTLRETATVVTTHDGIAVLDVDRRARTGEPMEPLRTHRVESELVLLLPVDRPSAAAHAERFAARH